LVIETFKAIFRDTIDFSKLSMKIYFELRNQMKSKIAIETQVPYVEA
jgi:hypothetical protein